MSQYRLPMPLVDVDQRFGIVDDLEHALASLYERIVWFLYTRSAAEIDEEYNDLGVYVWTVKLDDDYVTHVELAERRHALSHYPDDALSLPFKGTWTLRRIEEAVKSENWIASFIMLGVDQFFSKFTDVNIETLNSTLDAVRAASRVFLARLESDPTADPAEFLSEPYEVVIECAYDDEAWTVHRDGGSELRECTPYTSPLPDSVRTRGELIEYLKSERWNWILFTLHQDYDAFHGPNPVKLD